MRMMTIVVVDGWMDGWCEDRKGKEMDIERNWLSSVERRAE